VYKLHENRKYLKAGGATDSVFKIEKVMHLPKSLKKDADVEIL